MSHLQKLTLDEGKFLVKLARESVSYYLKERRYPNCPSAYPNILNEKMGIFTTISTFPKNELRGCIGYPYASESLIELCLSSSIKAATQDPRFESLDLNELNNVIFEVTILSPMILLDPNINYEEQIKIGRDGLLVVCEAYSKSGLLLPQVATEWNFDKKTFLKEVCRKALIFDNCTKDKNCKFYRFESQIFKEVSPKSDIEEEVLNERNI